MSAYSSSPPPPGETGRERNNRIVSDLSARVVAGWTLLASTCPICQTALVRSKDAQTYCVGCRMFIVTEAEAHQRNIAASSAGSALAAAASSAPAARTLLTASTSSSPLSVAVPPISPRSSSARSPSSRASQLSQLSPASSASAANDPSLAPTAASASTPASTASPFSMFRTDTMSSSAPPREDGGSGGSLSSSPHYARLMEQLTSDSAPRQSSAQPSASAVPATSSTSAVTATEAVDGSGVEAERSRVSNRVSRTNSLSAALGEKMLAGWTLLGIHCPNDHCPLMKNPRTGDMLCVDCGTVYPASGGESASGRSTTGSTPATSTTTSSTAAPSLVTVNQQPTVAPVNGSSAALRGPAVTNASVRSGETEPRASRAIVRAVDGDDADEDDDEADDSDERLDLLAASRLGRVNGSLHADTNGSSPPAATASATASTTTTINEVSAALSEKLLQGWTMLAVECPNRSCACPLMRKKQGPMLCVQCGSTVVTQEEKERMDEEDSKRGAAGAGGVEHRATEGKAAEEKISVQQRESSTASQVEANGESQPSKNQNEERSGSRSGKRTAFADQPEAGATESSGEKRLKNEDDLSDRLSALSSTSLVNSLSSSPLIRPSVRPSAISSTRPYRAPPITDASPSSHTPPSTPAPFPFASPLPASQHLSASISSAFSSHPLFPPPGHITRHNSMAGGADTGGLPYHASVGMGSLVFGGGAVSQPHARLSSSSGTQLHEKGKFSFRSSSAAPAVSQPQSAPVSAASASGLLSAPPSAAGEGSGGMGLASPVTVSPAHSDGGPPVALSATRPPQHPSSVLSGSVDALYGKLDVLRGQLVTCSQVDGMQQIAAAMKEIGQALKVLQSL